MVISTAASFLPIWVHPERKAPVRLGPSFVINHMGRTLENLEQFGIDVVLGRRRGSRAAILRGILYALSFIYERIVQFRLYFYRKRIFRERTLGCLVISIGNLTVGGTGKTPVVEKFARALQTGEAASFAIRNKGAG